MNKQKGQEDQLENKSYHKQSVQLNNNQNLWNLHMLMPQVQES